MKKSTLREGPASNQESIVTDSRELVPPGCPEGATAVGFELELKEGETRLQTWFSLDEGERGAFFVEVERL